MFDNGEVTAARVRRWVTMVAEAGGPGDSAARIDLIRSLEELSCAVAGLQAQAAADFDRAERAAAAAAGVPKDRRGRGIAAQIGLARRESPNRGVVHLGLAKALVDEMPCTLAALRAGAISEWRATLIVRETGCLSETDRAEVDRLIAADRQRLAAMGDKEIVAEVQQHAYRLDPHVWVNRRAKAESERSVTIRPAPDSMAYLTALLPMAQGVAAYKTLRDAVSSSRATGDDRSDGHVMADALVQRLIDGGADSGDASGQPSVSVMVNLTVSDRVLFGECSDAGHVEGYGPVPADLARDLVHRSGTAGLARLRRVYAKSDSGTVVTMDRRTRLFPKDLASLIRIRDRTCRTPYCDAPIRHIDHLEPAAAGGETSMANGQGLCEACNHAKQARRWHSRGRIGPSGRHRSVITTPTGHRYVSDAPPAVNQASPQLLSKPRSIAG